MKVLSWQKRCRSAVLVLFDDTTATIERDLYVDELGGEQVGVRV